MKRTSIAPLLACLLLATASQAQSPFISRVYEYRPAPGQFINDLPEYDPGDTADDMRLKVEECLAYNEQILVSLGGYGGYVVFGFDHMVANVPGEYDFKIIANAFYANANPNPDAPREGGSCEPGIVLVSYDANDNHLPDDPWYELAGSEYNAPETIHNYQITYYKPDPNKPPTPDSNHPYLNDTTYIRWTTNGHGDGYLYRNTYHPQPFYPQWLNEPELVFTGSKLADNYVDESGIGRYYVQYAYPWGYADNQPNNDRRSNFNIEWAIDEAGQPVQLPGIHFVKVYTAVNQYCGWLGETSTEIMGAQDLHLLPWIGGFDNGHPYIATASATLLNTRVGDYLVISSEIAQTAAVYSLQGIRLMNIKLHPGINTIPCEKLPKGIYILTVESTSMKFIK
jgi:hypothetical protein